MNKTRLILLFFGVLAAALVGTAVYNLKRLDLGDCGNAVVETVPSPDGRIDAVLFERNCGATTSFSAHVSLIEAGTELPNEYGNAISIKGRPADVIGGLSWTDETTLEVTVTTDELVNQTKDYPFDVEVVVTR